MCLYVLLCPDTTGQRERTQVERAVLFRRHLARAPASRLVISYTRQGLLLLASLIPKEETLSSLTDMKSFLQSEVSSAAGSSSAGPHSLLCFPLLKLSASGLFGE